MGVDTDDYTPPTYYLHRLQHAFGQPLEQSLPNSVLEPSSETPLDRIPGVTALVQMRSLLADCRVHSC